MTDKPQKISQERQGFMYAGTEQSNLHKYKYDEKDKLDKDDLDDLWVAINELSTTFNDWITEIINRIKKIEIDIDILKKNIVNIYNIGDKVAEGDGIDIEVDSHTKVISVDVGNGLQYSVDADPKVQVNDYHGITVNANGVSVKPKTDSGIAVDTDGVAVLPGDGIDIGSGGVSLDIKADRGLQITSTELDTKLHTSGTYENSIKATSDGLHVWFKTS